MDLTKLACSQVCAGLHWGVVVSIVASQEEGLILFTEEFAGSPVAALKFAPAACLSVTAATLIWVKETGWMDNSSFSRLTRNSALTLALVFAQFSGQAVAEPCSARWRACLIKVGFLSSRQHFRMLLPLCRQGTAQRALALSSQTYWLLDIAMLSCCICRCFKPGQACV